MPSLVGDLHRLLPQRVRARPEVLNGCELRKRRCLPGNRRIEHRLNAAIMAARIGGVESAALARATVHVRWEVRGNRKRGVASGSIPSSGGNVWRTWHRGSRVTPGNQLYAENPLGAAAESMGTGQPGNALLECLRSRCRRAPRSRGTTPCPANPSTPSGAPAPRSHSAGVGRLTRAMNR